MPELVFPFPLLLPAVAYGLFVGFEKTEENPMPDAESPKPQSILLKRFDPPFKIPDGHELVVSYARGDGGALTRVQIDVCPEEADPIARGSEAFGAILEHAVVSGVAILEVSAVAWSRVAGGLQWVARKVGS